MLVARCRERFRSLDSANWDARCARGGDRLRIEPDICSDGGEVIALGPLEAAEKKITIHSSSQRADVIDASTHDEIEANSDDEWRQSQVTRTA
jgi:hypothetical protein